MSICGFVGSALAASTAGQILIYRAVGGEFGAAFFGGYAHGQSKFYEKFFQNGEKNGFLSVIDNVTNPTQNI